MPLPLPMCASSVSGCCAQTLAAGTGVGMSGLVLEPEDNAVAQLGQALNDGSDATPDTSKCGVCNKKLTRDEIYTCKRNHLILTCDEDRVVAAGAVQQNHICMLHDVYIMYI